MNEQHNDIAALIDRIAALEEAVCELQAALESKPRVENHVAGEVGSVLQAGTIDNLTIQ